MTRAKLTRSRVSLALTVADKTSLSILGDTDLCFEIEGNRFRANVSVSPAIDDFLLGSDWLEANRAKWDFATGTLQLGDCEIRAYRRTLGKMCRQVTVAEDTVVPARHEVNVPVQMTDKNIPHPAKNWVIETKQLSSRVMTARTLVDGRQKRLVARVCNYSNEPFELKANYCLARAEPVEYVPKPGEGLQDEWRVSRNDVSMLSVSAGTPGSTDSPPATGRSPTATPNATTVSTGLTAAGADVPAVDATAATGTALPPDKPKAEGPYSHIQCLIDGLPDDLTDEQRARAADFIRSRSDVFSRSEYDIGRTRIIPHRIDTGDNAPHFEQLRRHPTTQLPMIDEHVEHMLAHDVIEPAASPWSSNVVMVRKQDGSMRFCVDYRKVNELIKKDKFPLPKIDTCLDTLNGCQYYSSCDLRWGYWQTEIDERDRDKTAFVTRKGQWRFKVLSFGLCNAPSQFAWIMELVMSGLTYDICLVYLDDILVFSKTFEEHCDRLSTCLLYTSDAADE